MEKKVKKTSVSEKGMSRRDFLATAATGIAGFMILPSFTVDGVRVAPSDRVVLGFVGLGQQGCSDFRSFAAAPERAAGSEASGNGHTSARDHAE
jgi:hypothetical protein